MAADENDEVLAAAYRRGDTWAFERIYRIHVDAITMLVARGFSTTNSPHSYVHGISDAQVQCDIVQETFVRVFSEKARRGFQVGRPFRPYLVRVAKNIVLDRLRRQKLWKETSTAESDPDAGVDLIDEALDLAPEDPAVAAHTRRQAEATREFAGALTGPERHCYELRYDQAMSQETVASQMGISRRQVRRLEEGLRRNLLSFLKSRSLWP